ncbi:hypothetical protein ACFUMH_16185 [Cellulomonas sp. NPDC057328]|uniref:hypothetical protein n=1 Tax=Cellulomonas sp. NPDC057328 TaxID=3346101 RepID=UPI00363F44A9
MTGERLYPVLTFPDLDEALDFYAALGFRTTYRQLRPYASGVVQRDDMAIHLSGVDGYDPAASLGSAIVVVPDAGALYASFAAGLRERYGRLPSAGVPRLLRPRRKQGTTTGFTVVDTGGNWLRFYGTADVADGDAEDGDGATRSTGLARALEVAARQGDARGDEATALAVLERALVRHPDGAPEDRVRVLLYRAELLVRTGDPDAARAALDAATAVPLDAAQRAAVADDLAHGREVVGPA